MEISATRPSFVRRALELWDGPKVLDFWMGQVNSLWSWDHAQAKVIERIAEAESTTTLVLKPNRKFKGFKAGQHVNIGVELDGVRHIRSYSASDAPRGNRRLQITVKATDSGKVSQALQTLPLGSIVSLSEAFGELALPNDQHDVLMLAAGSGITPMLALIHEQADLEFPRPIRLMVWARARAQHIQAETLRELARQHPNFNVQLALTREAAQTKDELQGRINAEHLDDVLKSQPHVLACGPFEFVETARELTEQHARSFIAEAFTPPPRAQGVDTQGTARVTLARTGVTLDVPRDVSLLEALEAQGLKPKHGCRMGICNTCACGKKDGATRDLHHNRIDHEAVHSVRICTHAAHSDLTLDL